MADNREDDDLAADSTPGLNVGVRKTAGEYEYGNLDAEDQVLARWKASLVDSARLLEWMRAGPM
ncbi:hypothetical protein BC827DRAFT_1264828 [Russula dissimulans]|nr:hypothetical protein BC827DRAFT_1264828 [Russula dissimulans]